MEIVCDYNICTGCGLCVAECPKQCISLTKRGHLDHFYPQIDTHICIDCGLCKKKCPAIRNVILKKAQIAFAAWSRDENDYVSSSSGGAGAVFSKHVILNGGSVYGCAMLPNVEVKHIRVANAENLEMLKGSKYVQSNIIEIIPLLKEDVNLGHTTLFIGTPCQVAAIKSLYKVQPKNLILVDIICHGVPSLDLLKKHIKKVAPSSHYDSISFRKGTNFFLLVREGEKVIYNRPLSWPPFKEWYMDTFFYGYTYRQSCYQCRYACPERISDITIGDFWGLGEHLSTDDIPPHQNGCSVIMPITHKGRQFVHNISHMMNLYVRPVEEAINGNDQLRAPVYLSRRRRVFRWLYSYIGKKAYYISIADIIFKNQLHHIIKKFTQS